MTTPEQNQEEFEEPSNGVASFDAYAESADVPEVAALSEVSTPLLDAKAAIEDQLNQQISATPSALAADSLSGAGNIQGVGIGLGNAASLAGEAPPGAPSLTIYVAEQMTPAEVRSLVVESLGVRAAASDVPFSVVVTGIVEAQPHRFRDRPAPGGISAGHVKVTAGTLGCLSRGRTAPRDARLLMLSNNHVLANVNDAKYGDCITQPGTLDGGSCPADQVAILERFVPISFTGPNFVDCATGWCWPDRVRPELVYLSSGSPVYFRIGNTPTAPTLGMTVGKSGRTTQLTSGRITGVGVTVNVNMGGGRIAQFRDQVSVQASSGDFSAGGDSGSVIWTWDSNRTPVALLNAGGGGTTFANRMDRVLAALDINLYT